MIDGERIVFVGERDAALAFAGADADSTNLNGGVAMPGFVDAHAHLLMTGACIAKAQLRTAAGLGEIQQRVAAWAAANPHAPRVLGVSWQFSAVPGGAPNRQMLDAVVSDRPVYLDANDLHSSWVNTAALAELGIDRNTPDPIGGRIVRDANGDATGHLLENATVELVWPLLGRISNAERDQQLALALRAYNETGVTSAVDMAVNAEGLATMSRAEQDGTLTVRIIAHWIVHRAETPAEELAQVEQAAHMAATYNSDQLRVVGIKLITDGTIDACTAAMIDPYSNGTNCGPIWDDESLTRVVVAADAAGLQIALHAIGDAAVRSAIDALEHAAQVNGTSGRRHRIEHLEYTDEADVVRLAGLGITASMQPVHIDPAVYDNWGAMLGEPRANRGFAWREFLDAGTLLAFGTDTPTAPHEPLHNMYIAATRKSPGNPALKPHRPDNALPMAEAVIHGTRDAAWASQLDHLVGDLTVGKAADIIVLDQDPFALGPDSLLTARVVETIMSGATVYRSR